MPSPPEPAGPRPQARSYLAEEEARRLLTTANVHLRRGQTAEAERIARDALTKIPEDAGAHEMLGDVLLAQGAGDGARDAYRAALKIEPGRASAEAKLARAILRQSEDRRRQSLGVAYAASDAALMRSSGEDDPRRRTREAVLSAFLPGLGQIMGGQYVKGGILLAVYFLSLLLMSASADRSTLVTLGQVIRFKFASLNSLTLILLAVSTLDWLYAVVDAARQAGTKH